MTTDYEELANAIILQAVKDYRAAKKKLKNVSAVARKEMLDTLREEKKNKIKRKKTVLEKALLTLRECESFFCSDWLGVLSTLDGKALLKTLQEEE